MSPIDRIRERLQHIKRIGVHTYGNTVYFGPYGPDAGSMIHCQGGGAGPSAWVAMPGAVEAAEALAAAPKDIEYLLAEVDVLQGAAAAEREAVVAYHRQVAKNLRDRVKPRRSLPSGVMYDSEDPDRLVVLAMAHEDSADVIERGVHK